TGDVWSAGHRSGTASLGRHSVAGTTGSGPRPEGGQPHDLPIMWGCWRGPARLRAIGPTGQFTSGGVSDDACTIHSAAPCLLAESRAGLLATGRGSGRSSGN